MWIDCIALEDSAENALAINSLGPNKGPLPADAANPHVDANPTQTPDAKRVSTQVAFSSAARKMLDAREDESRDIDIKRVAALSADLAAGLIPIDASRIADSVIDVTNELLKVKSGEGAHHERD